MNAFSEWLKVLLLGILEGVTEWLPISSTGHLLLLDGFLSLNQSEEFKEVFFVVIQLGAILAVPLLFWDEMILFRREGQVIRFQGDSLSRWLKVILACVPGAAVTLLFDNAIDGFLNHTKIGGISLLPVIIAAALILYGAIFLLIERKNKVPHIQNTKDIRYTDALLIGLFQTLSVIPGTSRSGSTIIGAIALGISRPAAAEFTFFLAVPVMLGYSLLKLLKFGFIFTASEAALLVAGTASAFLTSLFVIRALMSYVQKHSFSSFGIYRIVLGIAVLLYFLL